MLTEFIAPSQLKLLEALLTTLEHFEKKKKKPTLYFFNKIRKMDSIFRAWEIHTVFRVMDLLHVGEDIIFLFLFFLILNCWDKCMFQHYHSTCHKSYYIMYDWLELLNNNRSRHIQNARQKLSNLASYFLELVWTRKGSGNGPKKAR